MNCVICAIAKLENNYINEWCHWHLNLGFKHIYIYDNNDLNYPNVRNCISDDIKDKVTFFDIRGNKPPIQGKSYTEFYKNHNTEFDWCAFIDVDEFIILSKWKTIDDMVTDKIFKNANIITFTWRMMTDNNLITRDVNTPVMQSFTEEFDLNKNNWYCQQKELVKGSNQNIKWIQGHKSFLYEFKNVNRYTCDGKENNGTFRENDYTAPGLTYNAWINHYRTKSLQEFIDNKYNKSDAANMNFFKETLDYYWNLNDKTPEKLEYLRKRGIKYE